MKNTFILCAFLALSSFTVAQQSEKYPLGDYTELTDTKPHDSDEIWDKLSAPTQLSWGTTDIRYPKLSIPDVKKSNRGQTKAWKGERVNAQAVLWTKVGLEDASITVSDLKSGSSIIPSSAITTNFVRYVMTAPPKGFLSRLSFPKVRTACLFAVRSAQEETRSRLLQAAEPQQQKTSDFLS